MKKRFDYYFMERNGLWSERLAEYEEKGGEASSIAILIHACEIGDGIDQHASEHLKAVSAYIAAQADAELAELAELAVFTARLETAERIEQAAKLALSELKSYHDDWNKELDVTCVPNCPTMMIINELAAALKAGQA